MIKVKRKIMKRINDEGQDEKDEQADGRSW
jgi:hypothetical protein